jgi:hypothetical protein
MMSAHRDWRRRLPIRRSAARLQPLAWALDGQRRSIPRAGDRELTVILLAFLRGGRFGSCRGRRFAEQISLVTCGVTLRAV